MATKTERRGAPGKPKTLQHKRKIKRALRAYWANVRRALAARES
jgi:hypothetical protein